MRNLIVSTILFYLTAGSAIAQQDVQELDLDADLSSLATIYDSRIAVVNGTRFAAVQPRIYVTFKHRSCRRMSFKLLANERDDVLFVAVNKRSDVDCFGPSIRRQYKVQIASDRVFKPIVVVNPVGKGLTDDPRLAPPGRQICTAIAGALYNPETGRCQGFTNGCQQASMLASGFTRPADGQCKSEF